jgi:hypothetical protein
VTPPTCSILRGWLAPCFTHPSLHTPPLETMVVWELETVLYCQGHRCGQLQVLQVRVERGTFVFKAPKRPNGHHWGGPQKETALGSATGGQTLGKWRQSVPGSVRRCYNQFYSFVLLVARMGHVFGTPYVDLGFSLSLAAAMWTTVPW